MEKMNLIKIIDTLHTVSNGRVVLNRYSGSSHTKYLSFNIIFQRNDLIYLRAYTKRQKKLHRVIKKLYEERHLSFKAIADKFNKLSIKTRRGKTFSGASIHSILKKKKERDLWIKEVRNKKYPVKVSNLQIL